LNKRIIDSIPEIVLRLKKNEAAQAGAFLGFDACIDSIVRIVRDKDKDSEKIYFSTSSQFGEFLISQKNKSCGVELDTKLSKIGGNMVITANALGNLGIGVECVGTFGYPDILPVFRSMSENCSLHTIADTINATALEFNDSKVIVFDPGPYNKLSWEDIKSIIGIDRITEMVAGKNLVSFLNWSEIEKSSEIWKGFIDEVLPILPLPEKRRDFFTDLSDCSRKPKQEILSIPGLLKEFKNYFRVTLSLNQNEAELVTKAMGINADLTDEEFIKSLFAAFNADILVLHRVKDAIAFDGIRTESCDTFYCSDPVILTGGGDNFNAGFCFALLNNLDLFQTILVANAVSGSYVKTGISPDVDELMEFLEKIYFKV
jgi:hypothetical protein